MMRRFLHRLLVVSRLACVLFALSLGACQRVPDAGQMRQPQAWLMPGVRVSLPAPGISPAISEQPLLTATVNGKPQSLQVLLSADQQKIMLAGLTPAGIRLFLLTYDQQGLHTEQALALADLPPASQVLADIMLSHWPLSAWQGRLPAGWQLVDEADQRELRDPQGTVITRIVYQIYHGRRVPVALSQYAFHYHLDIQYPGG